MHIRHDNLSWIGYNIFLLISRVYSDANRPWSVSYFQLIRHILLKLWAGTFDHDNVHVAVIYILYGSDLRWVRTNYNFSSRMEIQFPKQWEEQNWIIRACHKKNLDSPRWIYAYFIDLNTKEIKLLRNKIFLKQKKVVIAHILRSFLGFRGQTS